MTSPSEMHPHDDVPRPLRRALQSCSFDCLHTARLLGVERRILRGAAPPELVVGRRRREHRLLLHGLLLLAVLGGAVQRCGHANRAVPGSQRPNVRLASTAVQRGVSYEPKTRAPDGGGGGSRYRRYERFELLWSFLAQGKHAMLDRSTEPPQVTNARYSDFRLCWRQ